MDLTNFTFVFHWLVVHGYFLMFLIMCVEGPITTTAAAFAAALGYFSLPVIFILSILGDIVPDSIYYFIGRVARHQVVDKYGHKFGLSDLRMQKIEAHLKKHYLKTLLVIKLTPFLAVPGFMIVGSTRGSFSRFLVVCSLITLIKTTIFVVMGYFFGRLYDIGTYVKYGNLILIFFVPLFLIFYFSYKKFTKWLGTKFEKI